MDVSCLLFKILEIVFNFIEVNTDDTDRIDKLGYFLDYCEIPMLIWFSIDSFNKLKRTYYFIRT